MLKLELQPVFFGIALCSLCRPDAVMLLPMPMRELSVCAKFTKVFDARSASLRRIYCIIIIQSYMFCMLCSSLCICASTENGCKCALVWHCVHVACAFRHLCENTETKTKKQHDFPHRVHRTHKTQSFSLCAVVVNFLVAVGSLATQHNITCIWLSFVVLRLLAFACCSSFPI